MRTPISPEEKLAVTFRFLATSESYQNLLFQFKIHQMTMANFIPKVCWAIYNNLKDEHLRVSNTPEEWGRYEAEIRQRWQFPNCTGVC